MRPLSAAIQSILYAQAAEDMIAYAWSPSCRWACSPTAVFADDTQDVAETQEKAGLKEECIEFYDKVQLLARIHNCSFRQ